ncbi:MAG: DNA adenine methylase [Thermus sp.]|nr:DNA adenine methylase [Thermus sp.]
MVGGQMIKYIGSKRVLVPWIVDTIALVRRVDSFSRIADLFSGSSRVAHALKRAGFWVMANDINTYALVLAKALVEADARMYPKERIDPILDELMRLPPKGGWFTQKYCREARYFQPKNGERIEAIREAIEGYAEDPLLKAILLTSLMLGADRVDSTTGVQMAYLKTWAPRAYGDLRLEYPPLLPGGGLALQGDALEIAGNLDVDAVYLDPPYNQHSYLGNYHVWETLVLWDNPEVYGVARKRVDVRRRKSPFNSKKEAKGAMEKLLSGLRVRHLFLSFSNEGFFTPKEIEDLLRGWGYTVHFTRPHKRYVGALIGIYNPKGEKVGKVSHTENEEYLFVATQDKRVYEELAKRAGTLQARGGEMVPLFSLGS